jgi:hypothetical protein
MDKLIGREDSKRERCSYDLPGKESCKWIDEAFDLREEIKALKLKKEWLCKHLAGQCKAIVHPCSPLGCPPGQVWCPEHQDCFQCWSEAADKANLTSSS